MPAAAYLGNDNLKGQNTIIGFTEQQLLEIAKCAEDPCYFINNYVKIIHVDHGLVNFSMYPYQEDIVKLYHNNRFVILKLPRQSGKCLADDSFITVTHKKFPSIKIKISVGMFFVIISLKHIPFCLRHINIVYEESKRRMQNLWNYCRPFKPSR
jgi:hypothetical protein